MITLIIPYYCAPQMLRVQMEAIAQYPPGYTVIVVDDGSPEPAEVPKGVQLYRIHEDIPWNRGGARNLGAHVADTKWILHVDVDHVLPPACAEALLNMELDRKKWYRFKRYRVGKADATRRKDTISDNVEFGPVKPHIDSYLVRREVYWKAGGYDEDYSGCLGGGSPFLYQLKMVAPMEVLPAEAHLYVYTRDKVPDASVSTLSRDTSEYTRRRNQKGKVKGKRPLRFGWERIQ